MKLLFFGSLRETVVIEGELRLVVVVVIVFFLASEAAARGREKEGGSSCLEWLKC